MATVRLYYDSAELSFDAVIMRHDDDPTRVILDRTAFYPTSGGQPHDLGTLNGVSVTDVTDVEDDIIHVLAGPLDLGPAHGEVDRRRRHDFTVQHTAQHLLSALASDRLGWDTSSVHFGEDHSTIEFTTETAPTAALQDLEQWCGDAIAAARTVSIGYEDSETSTGLRKPPARNGRIRVITIEGLDRSACGGTHVTSTAALGSLVLRDVERIRGRVRVSFLAGNRVIDLLRHQGSLLTALAGALSCSPDELPELVTRRTAALRDAEARVTDLERHVATLEAARLMNEGSVDPDGIRRLVITHHPGSVAGLRQLAQISSENSGVLFVGYLDAPPTIVVASHVDTGIDASARLKRALTVAGGRGGGSPRLAQGTVPDAAQLDSLISAVLATD